MPDLLGSAWGAWDITTALSCDGGRDGSEAVWYNSGMSSEQILNEALSLPAEERARLADRLLESLNSNEQKEIDTAWAEEIERRIDAYEKGETTARPAEEVLREMRERLRHR